MCVRVCICVGRGEGGGGRRGRGRGKGGEGIGHGNTVRISKVFVLYHCVPALAFEHFYSVQTTQFS